MGCIGVVAGVTIVSRHGIAREVLRMRRAVEGMPDHLRSEIKEFFADSKSGIYLLDLRSPENAEAIASHLGRLRTTYIGFDCRGRRVHEMRRL